jgi:hypothetical protein
VAACFRYRYELRDSDHLVATGHLTLEQPLQAGDKVAIGPRRALVRSVSATVGSQELQLVLELSVTETKR